MAHVCDMQLQPPQMRGSTVIDDSESQLMPMSPYIARDSMLEGPTGLNLVTQESIVAMETKEHPPFDVEATTTSITIIGNTSQGDPMDTSNNVVQDSNHPTEPTTSNTVTVNDNIFNAIGENMGQPSAEQMEVDQEGGVANLLEARNRPQQPKLPASTSSQDTLGSPMNRQRDAELPETRYFVEEEVLAGPEVLVLETINEEISPEAPSSEYAGIPSTGHRRRIRVYGKKGRNSMNRIRPTQEQIDYEMAMLEAALPSPMKAEDHSDIALSSPVLPGESLIGEAAESESVLPPLIPLSSQLSSVRRKRRSSTTIPIIVDDPLESPSTSNAPSQSSISQPNVSRPRRTTSIHQRGSTPYTSAHSDRYQPESPSQNAPRTRARSSTLPRNLALVEPSSSSITAPISRTVPPQRADIEVPIALNHDATAVVANATNSSLAQAKSSHHDTTRLTIRIPVRLSINKVENPNERIEQTKGSDEECDLTGRGESIETDEGDVKLSRMTYLSPSPEIPPAPKNTPEPVAVRPSRRKSNATTKNVGSLGMDKEIEEEDASLKRNGRASAAAVMLGTHTVDLTQGEGHDTAAAPNPSSGSPAPPLAPINHPLIDTTPTLPWNSTEAEDALEAGYRIIGQQTPRALLDAIPTQTVSPPLNSTLDADNAAASSQHDILEGLAEWDKEVLLKMADLIFEQVFESPDTLNLIRDFDLRTLPDDDGLLGWAAQKGFIEAKPVQGLPDPLGRADDNANTPNIDTNTNPSTQSLPYHDEIPISDPSTEGPVPGPFDSDDLSDVDATTPSFIPNDEVPTQSIQKDDTHHNRGSPSKPRAVSIVDSNASGPADDHSAHARAQSTAPNRPTMSSSSGSSSFPPLVVTSAPLLSIAQMRRPLTKYLPSRFDIAVPQGLNVGQASDYIDHLAQAHAESFLKMRREVAKTLVGPDMTSLAMRRAESREVSAEGVLNDDRVSTSGSPESGSDSIVEELLLDGGSSMDHQGDASPRISDGPPLSSNTPPSRHSASYRDLKGKGRVSRTDSGPRTSSDEGDPQLTSIPQLSAFISLDSFTPSFIDLEAVQSNLSATLSMRAEIDRLRAEDMKLQRAWVKERQPVNEKITESDDGTSQTVDLEHDELDLLNEGKREAWLLEPTGLVAAPYMRAPNQSPFEYLYTQYGPTSLRRQNILAPPESGPEVHSPTSATLVNDDYSSSEDEPISTKGRPVKRSTFPIISAPNKSHPRRLAKIISPSTPVTVYPTRKIQYDDPKVPSLVRAHFPSASPAATSLGLPISAASQSPDKKRKQFLVPTRTFSHVEVPRPPGHVERCRNTRWLHLLEPPRETDRSSEEGGSDDELVLSTANYKPPSVTHSRSAVQRKRRRQDESDFDRYEPNEDDENEDFSLEKSFATSKRIKLDDGSFPAGGQSPTFAFQASNRNRRVEYPICGSVDDIELSDITLRATAGGTQQMCHQCRNSSTALRPRAKCGRTVSIDGIITKCGKNFCGRCLQVWYGLDDDAIDFLLQGKVNAKGEMGTGFGFGIIDGIWVCPFCSERCMCTICSGRRGEKRVRLAPSSRAVFKAGSSASSRQPRIHPQALARRASAIPDGAPTSNVKFRRRAESLTISSAWHVMIPPPTLGLDPEYYEATRPRTRDFPTGAPPPTAAHFAPILVKHGSNLENDGLDDHFTGSEGEEGRTMGKAKTDWDVEEGKDMLGERPSVDGRKRKNWTVVVQGRKLPSVKKVEVIDLTSSRPSSASPVPSVPASSVNAVSIAAAPTIESVTIALKSMCIDMPITVNPLELLGGSVTSPEDVSTSTTRDQSPGLSKSRIVAKGGTTINHDLDQCFTVYWSPMDSLSSPATAEGIDAGDLMTSPSLRNGYSPSPVPQEPEVSPPSLTAARPIIMDGATSIRSPSGEGTPLESREESVQHDEQRGDSEMNVLLTN